jgi:hypothetical protein
METKEDKNEIQTEIKESYMGFEISKRLNQEIVKMLPAVWDSEEANEIPDSQGQVLVKDGSKAFLERKDDQKIIMIPISVDVRNGGVVTAQRFYVCTK